MDTIEQIKALGFDRHLSVIANAGSGKTRVLVKRFVNILLYHNIFSKNTPRLKTSEIVAITFTRKAASEMRSKIVIMLEKEIQQTAERDKLEKLFRIREELSNARISTIHSFCSALLREFPVESDVNPAFSEITAAQLNRIKKEAILSVFEDRLESKERIQKEQIEKLLLFFGRKQLEELISLLLNKIELFESLKMFYEMTVEEIINRPLSLFAKKYIPAIRDSVSGIVYLFKECYNVFNEKQRIILDGFLSTAEKLSNIINTGSKNSIDYLLRIYALLTEINGLVFTKSGSILSKIKKNTIDTQAAKTIEQYWENCTKLFGFFESLNEAGSEKDVIESAWALIDITEEIIARIDDEKAELTALDFGDMIIKISRLLDNPEAATKIRKKIKYLLVDEFQDTDKLQYSIITKLLPELANHELLNTIDKNYFINLFIVGDPKQSIYGFRNADVRVFRKAAEEIFRLNTALRQLGMVPQNMSSFVAAGEEQYKITGYDYSSEETRGKLSLTSTFRLQPVIAAFINKVCGNVMNDVDSEYEVGYSEFVCSRNTTDDALTQEYNSGRLALLIKIEDKNEKGTGNNDSGEDDEPTETEINNEAELLVRHLGNFIDGGAIIEEDGIETEVSYRDIAILARNRNRFADLENALLRHGIPYVLHSGRGFMKSQEVTDIVAFLNFLDNPSDNISLATVLRSPFFHFPDSLLFMVSQHQSGKYLWDKLKSFTGSFQDITGINEDLKGEYLEIIGRTLDILEGIFFELPSMPVTQVINAILEKTARFGTISDESKRDVIEYNINQLLEMARDFEKRSFSGFFDFVDELNFLMQFGIGENETAELTGADSVNIMTIHASKGLEFPVVYFFDSNAGKNRQDTYFISENYGFQFKSSIVRETEDGARALTGIVTPSFVMAKLENNEQQAAEDKRLLYVALSRARDYLFISGTVTISQMDKGLPNSFLGLIAQGLGAAPAGIFGKPLLVSQDILMNINGNITKKKINYNIGVYSEIERVFDSKVKPTQSDSGRMKLEGEIPFVIGGETYSPTALMQFFSEKGNYLKKYILSLRDDDDTQVSKSLDDELTEPDNTETEGTIPGIAIHGILERAAEWLGSSSSIDYAQLNSTAEYVLRQIQAAGHEENLMKRVIKECVNVAGTKLIRAHAGELLAARKEWELNMPVGDDFLKCIIDAAPLIDCNIEIWDWKTNRVDSPESKQELARHYELQMKIYCFLVSRINPGQQAYKARLLFTRLAAENAPDEAWTHTYTWTGTELQDYDKELEEYINKIKYEFFFKQTPPKVVDF